MKSTKESRFETQVLMLRAINDGFKKISMDEDTTGRYMVLRDKIIKSKDNEFLRLKGYFKRMTNRDFFKFIENV